MLLLWYQTNINLFIKVLNRFLIIVVSILFTQNLFGQAADNIEITKTDEQLVFSYDLIGKQDGVYIVDLFIELDNGEVIKPVTVFGDIGKVVTGDNKKIVWDVYKDVNSLSGSINANIDVSTFTNDNQIQATPKPPKEEKTVVDVPYNDLKPNSQTILFGGKIGLGNSSVNANIRKSSYQRQFSFDGAVFARYNVNRRIFVQPEVGYHLQAFNQILSDTASVETNLHYAKGQVLAGISPIGIGLYFTAGLYYSYLFGGNEVSTVSDNTNKTALNEYTIRNDRTIPFENTDIGYVLGGSLNFARGAFALGVLYSNSFTNHIDNFYWSGSGTNETLKRYNNSFRFYIQKAF